MGGSVSGISGETHRVFKASKWLDERLTVVMGDAFPPQVVESTGGRPHAAHLLMGECAVQRYEPLDQLVELPLLPRVDAIVEQGKPEHTTGQLAFRMNVPLLYRNIFSPEEYDDDHTVHILTPPIDFGGLDEDAVHTKLDSWVRQIGEGLLFDTSVGRATACVYCIGMYRISIRSH